MMKRADWAIVFLFFRCLLVMLIAPGLGTFFGTLLAMGLTREEDFERLIAGSMGMAIIISPFLAYPAMWILGGPAIVIMEFFKFNRLYHYMIFALGIGVFITWFFFQEKFWDGMNSMFGQLYVTCSLFIAMVSWLFLHAGPQKKTYAAIKKAADKPPSS
jgi:hypothetical protein